MKKYKTGKAMLFSTCIMMLAPSFSWAESPPFSGCRALGCIGKIGSIYIKKDGVIKIKAPDNVNTSPLNCTLSGGYFSLKESHVRFKEIYSMLLSAQISQKDVYLRGVENSSDCEIYYTVIYP